MHKHANYKDLSVGQLLSRAREIAGLSREELARRIGYQPRTLGRWERDIADPAVRTFLKFLEVCNVPLEVLFCVNDATTRDCANLLKVYNQLSRPRQQLILSIAQNQLDIERYQNSDMSLSSVACPRCGEQSMLWSDIHDDWACSSCGHIGVISERPMTYTSPHSCL